MTTNLWVEQVSAKLTWHIIIISTLLHLRQIPFIHAEKPLIITIQKIEEKGGQKGIRKYYQSGKKVTSLARCWPGNLGAECRGGRKGRHAQSNIFGLLSPSVP